MIIKITEESLKALISGGGVKIMLPNDEVVAVELDEIDEAAIRRAIIQGMVNRELIKRNLSANDTLSDQNSVRDIERVREKK